MAAAFAAWSGALVAGRFGGNPTGLFFVGELSKAAKSGVPGLYLHRNSHGYDGQFYYLLARDPFLRGSTAEFIDAPRLRARRILVPMAAWALALGRAEWVALSYVVVVVASAGLGCYFLGRIAEGHGRSAWWGLVFGALPAAAISAERMTVDIALAAAAAAACWCWVERRHTALWWTLCAAVLIRETGVLLVAAAVAASWMAGRRAWSMGHAAAVVPWLAWSAYVATRTGPVIESWLGVPFLGWWERVLHPMRYRQGSELLLQTLDFAALLGIAMAVLLAVRLALRRPIEFEAWCAVAFAALATAVSNADVWAEVYGFGRTQGVILLFLAVAFVRGGHWSLLVPTALLLPRLSIQMVYTQVAPLIWGG
jgi:hypothetical protein